MVPNVFGLAVLAPPLDKMGNSVRGIALIESIASSFNLNIFNQLMLGDSESVAAQLCEIHERGVRLQPDADARDFAHYQQRYLDD